ncbi:MAG: Rpn family recombination-promoting nuclease/putative transposase [Oscillospiraceae bacterium]|jgi:predicted transposase/invertase (TIGR01784 family)|nr:Rpn family recombination-promoting nuclease/putative transposase [Oscillospiraceae bacterium]
MLKKNTKSAIRAKANRRYKSSVFASYFSETNERLIEVYNAFSKVAYPTSTPIEINTIDNALFYGFINDVSFVLNDLLIVMIEHQSTWNPNMPFRILLYLAEILKRLYHDPKPFYKSTLQKIDKVRCFVLYNGTEDRPDVSKLRLSDAFKEVIEDIDDPELDIQLELVVPVYNISAGRNLKILAKSKSLQEYSLFTAKVNEEKESGKELTDAVEAAIKYCIAHNIMSDYLSVHGTEVRSVLMQEMSIKDIADVKFNEGVEVGEARGVAMGMINERRKMAITMIQRNFPDELVADLTNLPIAEVRQLK